MMRSTVRSILQPIVKTITLCALGLSIPAIASSQERSLGSLEEIIDAERQVKGYDAIYRLQYKGTDMVVGLYLRQGGVIEGRRAEVVSDVELRWKPGVIDFKRSSDLPSSEGGDILESAALSCELGIPHFCLLVVESQGGGLVALTLDRRLLPRLDRELKAPAPNLSIKL